MLHVFSLLSIVIFLRFSDSQPVQRIQPLFPSIRNACKYWASQPVIQSPPSLRSHFSEIQVFEM